MTNPDDYRKMMDCAQPPAHLNARTLDRIAKLRDESDAEPVPVPEFTVKRHRPAVAFSLLLGGMAAAALLIGIAVAVPALLPAPPHHPSGTGAYNERYAGLFGLALYAEAGEIGQTVDIATGESGIEPDGTEGAFPITGILYKMNLTCVGDGISRITYAIDSDDVRFETVTMETADDGAQNPQRYSYSSNLTVDFDQQHPEELVYRIKVDLRSPELRAVQDRMFEAQDERARSTDPAETDALDRELGELESQYRDIVDAGSTGIAGNPESLQTAYDTGFYDASCQALASIESSVFSVTATFIDGTTATKRYRIAPVDNYEQVLADRIAAAQDPEAADDDPRLTAPFFTITEIR